MDKFYNFHNLINLKISCPSHVILGYENYLREFEVEKFSETPDYEIKDIRDFELPAEHLNASNFYIGFKNGIFLPKENYALVFEGKRIVEYAPYANKSANLLLQCVLLGRGVSLVHSAGIEYNGKGIIFPAFGGAGKTALVSGLRNLPNFKFYGDDFVAVNENAEMFSYPSDFSIYPYHVNLFPELKKTKYSHYLFSRKIFGPFFQLRKAVNFILRRLIPAIAFSPALRTWDANYIKVPARELVGPMKMGDKTKLTAAVFLSRYHGDRMVFKEITPGEIINEIFGVLSLEFRYALPYLAVASAFNVFDLAELQTRQREVLKKCFSGLGLYRALIPMRIPPAEYIQEMRQFLDKLTNNA